MGKRERTDGLFRRFERKRRSGLDVLLDVSKDRPQLTLQQAAEFAQHARAVDHTIVRWAAVPSLPVWAAFALFHRFDPGVLDLQGPDQLRQIEEIGHAARGRGVALLQFCIDLRLLRQRIDADPEMAQRIPKDSDPLQVSVDPAWFVQWLERNGFRPEPWASFLPEIVLVVNPPERLRKLLAVNQAVYRPLEEGGTFDPRYPGELAVTKQALQAAGIKSDRLSGAGATYLARPGQGQGRKRQKR